MSKSTFPDWPNYSKDEVEKVKDIILSNKVNYWTGNECKKFESEFAKYIGVKYSIALSNGTVALELALEGLGIGEGDEVLVTSKTFIASVSCIVRAGATPVFVDISKNSQNMLVSNIKRSIGRKTKAIICVHHAGWSCEMSEIKKISKKHNLFIIEDCAQAHGAIYKGQKVGSIGDVGCWSFCQDKIITTLGEGGMITTNNQKLWDKIWSLKDHGKNFKKTQQSNPKAKFLWLHDRIGTNARMTEIQAASGRIQLKKLKKWTKIRNAHQDKIWNKARSIRGLRVPLFRCDACDCDEKKIMCTHAGYKCYLFLDTQYLRKNWPKEKIISEIRRRGVPCFEGSCSEVYLEKAFDKSKFKPKRRFKNASELSETTISFLIHPTLTEKEINKTCKVLELVLNQAAK